MFQTALCQSFRLAFASALRGLLVTLLVASAGVSQAWAAAKPPTPAQALTLEPIQENVEYDTPSKSQIAGCTIKPEKENGATAWVVRNEQNQILRRFADTNGDNVVDLWGYYRDGLEVYRDIDSDYDAKADQYRWFHTGGTRWGTDKNQDGKIDGWRRISPQEVAEELFHAIQARDQNAFASLLISDRELKASGLGRNLADELAGKAKRAPTEFRSLLQKQKVISASSRFVDFGASRPGLIPAGFRDSQKDVVVYEGASTLIDNGGKPEQIQLGVMVQIGDAWRLVEAPQIGSDGMELSNVFTASQSSPASVGGSTAPTEEMTQLMAELQKIDTQASTAKQRSATIDRRAELLLKLAKVTPDRELRDQWYNQLADMYSAAVLEGEYGQGIKALENLERDLRAAKASKNVVAHVRFQRIWSDWGLKSQDPKQDYAKVQEDWHDQLKAFAKAYPSAPDTAEAYLQLGMASEFARETEEAADWYQQLAKEFPNSPRGRKAAGAIRRLKSADKPIELRGEALSGGMVDIASYRGKYVLVQYWATWCEACKSDMAQIKELLAKYGDKGFDVVGVNLDSNASAARQYLASNRLPWKQVYDEGGLEGRLATEMGIMTPQMMLLDDKGRVIDQNIYIAELDSELRRLLK